MHSITYDLDVREEYNVVSELKIVHNAVRCGIMKLTEAECLEVLCELRERGIL